MIFDFFKQSRMYFLIVTILGLLFFVISMFFSDYVILMDEWAIYVVSEYLVSDTLTIVMKIVTNLGGVLAFASFLFVLFLVISTIFKHFYRLINFENLLLLLSPPRFLTAYLIEKFLVLILGL